MIQNYSHLKVSITTKIDVLTVFLHYKRSNTGKFYLKIIKRQELKYYEASDKQPKNCQRKK